MNKRKCKKEGLTGVLENLRIRIIENPNKLKKMIQEDTIEEWRRQWAMNKNESTLRKYFPIVQSRLDTQWILMDYWVYIGIPHRARGLSSQVTVLWAGHRSPVPCLWCSGNC